MGLKDILEKGNKYYDDMKEAGKNILDPMRNAPKLGSKEEVEATKKVQAAAKQRAKKYVDTPPEEKPEDKQ